MDDGIVMSAELVSGCFRLLGTSYERLSSAYIVNIHVWVTMLHMATDSIAKPPLNPHFGGGL